MQHSKDFLEREIQKITMLLAALLGKLSQLEDPDEMVREVDGFLKKEFDFTLSEILQMENPALELKIKSIHIDHVEKLSEIMYFILKKMETQHTFPELDKAALINKIKYLIDYSNRNSTTFSVERMKMKEDLEQIR